MIKIVFREKNFWVEGIGNNSYWVAEIMRFVARISQTLKYWIFWSSFEYQMSGAFLPKNAVFQLPSNLDLFYKGWYIDHWSRRSKICEGYKIHKIVASPLQLKNLPMDVRFISNVRNEKECGGVMLLNSNWINNWENY